MIDFVSEGITTRLTVLNYDSYQQHRTGSESASEQQANRERVTNNNDNNDNKKEYMHFERTFCALWKTLPVAFKQPTKLTSGRRTKLKIRFNESAFRDNAQNIITKISTSEYLAGAGWFNFDWIIKNSENYQKVLDGNYDGIKSLTPKAPYVDQDKEFYEGLNAGTGDYNRCDTLQEREEYIQTRLLGGKSERYMQGYYKGMQHDPS